MLMPMVSKNVVPELALAVCGAESNAPSKPKTGKIASPAVLKLVRREELSFLDFTKLPTISSVRAQMRSPFLSRGNESDLTLQVKSRN